VPSPAATAFDVARGRARTVAALSQDPRVRPLTRENSRLLLHIALAIYVAGWESYIERLIANFFSEVFDPHLSKFVALHRVTSQLASSAAEKFHTPNWENARDLLLQFSGYDPINDWIWPQRSMGGPQVRERLNQILKVRHSFAHGFPMPPFDWNTSAMGDARLTVSAVRDTEAFFSNLIVQTDRGLGRHIQASYNPNLNW